MYISKTSFSFKMWTLGQSCWYYDPTTPCICTGDYTPIKILVVITQFNEVTPKWLSY